MPKKSKARGKKKKISKEKTAAKKTKAITLGKKYGIAGIISALIGLFFLPIIFGILAVVLGVIARKKDEKRLGTLAIIFGGVVLIILAFALLILYLG